MKNKLFAVIGILTYILSVVSSTLDKDGNYPLSPIYIYLYLIASIAYTVIVFYNLWGSNSIMAILFFIVTIIYITYDSYVTFINPLPNTSIILMGNISNAIRAVMIWVTIVTFWRRKTLL